MGTTLSMQSKYRKYTPTCRYPFGMPPCKQLATHTYLDSYSGHLKAVCAFHALDIEKSEPGPIWGLKELVGWGTNVAAGQATITALVTCNECHVQNSPAHATACPKLCGQPLTPDPPGCVCPQLAGQEVNHLADCNAHITPGAPAFTRLCICDYTQVMRDPMPLANGKCARCGGV